MSPPVSDGQWVELFEPCARRYRDDLNGHDRAPKTIVFFQLPTRTDLRMFGSLKTLAILCLALGLAAGTEKKWWETASFYQIYPRSFKDSDGDGVGDLKGVTEELAYLKEIGITATWLSPIFTSPMADFGYDIANFTEIDPLFGTMEDFENMMTQAKSLGIKILLDLVPNHSSDECDWFQRSVNGDPEYEDFYVWHPGKIVDGVRQPPSNWISEFRGSMWTWREERQAYYLHQFIAKQPDFNYRNPNVREMMKGVMRFWLDKGIDGFRVDATHHLYEVAPDAEGNLPDEPRNFAVSDPESYDYLEHIYTLDQPENVDLIYEFRQVLDEYKAMFGGDDRILMTEAYSPIEVLMRYYGNGTAEGSQIPFNFLMIKTMTNASNAHDYAEVINEWMSNMPEGRTANWVMGNHDNNRIGSRLGVERMDLINMMMLTLPGCSITYNGEEIGMTDVWISWNDTVDPWGCNSNPEIYDTLSRDPERTPFQWDDTNNAGFSSGDSTWLPVADNYKLVNVKRERGIPLSHLNVYKQLHALRTEKTFSDGAVDILAASENVLGIKRFLDGEYTFVILLNLMSDVETVNLNAIFVELTPELEYVAITDKSIRRIGDKTYTDTVVLMPYEAIVLKTTSKIN